MLTLSGPSARIDEAKGMAEEIILRSQRSFDWHSFEQCPWEFHGAESKPSIEIYVIGLQQIGIDARMDHGNKLFQQVRQRASHVYGIDHIDQVVDTRCFHYPK